MIPSATDHFYAQPQRPARGRRRSDRTLLGGTRLEVNQKHRLRHFVDGTTTVAPRLPPSSPARKEEKLNLSQRLVCLSDGGTAGCRRGECRRRALTSRRTRARPPYFACTSSSLAATFVSRFAADRCLRLLFHLFIHFIFSNVQLHLCLCSHMIRSRLGSAWRRAKLCSA